METARGASAGPAPLSRFRRFVAGALLTLALLLLATYIRAFLPDVIPLLLTEALAALLGALVVASIVVGVYHAWSAHPRHRRAIVFVLAITLATLIAHAYVIDSPAAGAGASASGAAGSSFGDGRISANSSVAGNVMTVTVTAAGENAVSSLDLGASGGILSGGGFSPAPSFASPLQPGSSTTGTWTLQGKGSSTRITLSYQYLTCYSTKSKSYGCIMDEVYYVPEAMGILAGQHCSTTAPNCHMEHPPLVPALMAAGMAIFGEYNSAGWRVMPVLLGTFSIPLIFVIAWKASGSKKIAYLSASLFALDVMFFSQSSGGLLDAPEVFFGLAAFFAYFAELKVWKFDRGVIAGVLLGVAGLAKETSLFIALAFLTFVLLFGEGDRGARVHDAAKVVLVAGIVFAGGLQAYDSALATPAVPTFVQHVGYMLSYGSSLIAGKLACSPTTGYWCKFANDPGGPPILPTDWVVYYSPVAYYSTSVSVCPNVVNGVCQGGEYTYVATAYYGVTNLIETWTVFVWIPLAAYALYAHFRRPWPILEQFGFGGAGGSDMPGETRLAALALVMFVWSYFPYILLFLAGRVTYPFYFIPAVPAAAMGCSYWVSRSWFPRWLMAVYVGAVFLFFFVYFPEKAFLPDWLRVLIGH